MRFRELKLRKNPACPVCGEHRTITQVIDYEEFCGIRGEEAPAATTQVPEITPPELKARLDHGDEVFILAVREPHDYQICNLRGHLIPLGDLPRGGHEHRACARRRCGSEEVDSERHYGGRRIGIHWQGHHWRCLWPPVALPGKNAAVCRCVGAGRDRIFCGPVDYRPYRAGAWWRG